MTGRVGRLLKKFVEDEVPGRAAQLAYYAFVALPPALMALFGAAGLIGSARFAVWLEQQAGLVMPPAIIDTILRPFIAEVVLRSAPGPFSIGILLALWGASSVFGGLMAALNVAYGVAETRSWVRKRLASLSAMVGSVGLFLLAAIALLAGPGLALAAGLGGAAALAWSIVQWPLALAFVIAAFWIAYYLLPNRDQRGCRRVLLRVSGIAAVLWLAATAAFRLYIAHFSSYSRSYGFLGAFIILLLWLYLTGLVVLVGGELASDLQSRG